MCAACRKQVALVMRVDDINAEVTFTAKCHGSRSSFTIDDILLRASSGMRESLLSHRRFVAWAMDLFPHDNFPDMRELLAYNRGTLPATR